MKSINTIVLAVLVVIVALIMAPLMLDANDDILTANITNLTGLEQVAGVGPLIMLLGILTGAGFFGAAGFQGNSTAGRADVIKVVISIVVLVIGLIMFGIIISSTNTLWTAVGAAQGQVTAMQSVVGILPLIAYVGIIAGAGIFQWSAVKSVRAKRRVRRAVA